MRGICPLSSGSGGNMIYVGSEKTKLLFDVGLSFKKINEKLAEIDLTIDDIDAIVISHEHSDHIKGIEQIAKHTTIPILCNGDTAKAICEVIDTRPNFQIFSTGESFTFQDITINPFSIQHDTLDPVAFTLEFDSLKVGICTDLGFASNLVAHHLQNCDYLYIEANHEEAMVHACARPLIYKKRVLGRQGHLSNKACAELIEKVHHNNLKHIYLAHLSSECNDPDVALKTVSDHMKSCDIETPLSIAFQETISKKIEF
ncbi:MAG: putative metallo-hydrolase YycJ [Chlamydiia bacterium]|nr:putative metallo-hydrolase YycJ [Chlamydiia bacterium]